MMTELPGDRRLEGITALSKVDQSKLDPLERQAPGGPRGRAQAGARPDRFRAGQGGVPPQRVGGGHRGPLALPGDAAHRAEQLEASFMLGNALVQQRKYEPAIAR
jgi:hypothetical protein